MSKQYTFTSLFNDAIPQTEEQDLITIGEVSIPRIQRPYAQGRKSHKVEKIRMDFLDELFEGMMKDEEIDLNFVYGSVTGGKIADSEKYTFELLDGQQRFTTLFLLHWYILNKENLFDYDSLELQNPDIAKEVQECKKALNSFTYETRISSSEFCKELAIFKCDFSQETPSSCIRKARWYYHSYDKDSTIESMLVMLDSIDSKYKEHECSEIFSKLSNIRFYVLSLMEYKQSEELYMKMNARGLPLSSFENFKAELHGALYKVPYAVEEVNLLDSDGTLPYHLNFAIKLDTIWTDLFWNGNGDKFDRSYLRMFSRFFAARYMIDCGKTENDMRYDEFMKCFFTDAEKKSDIHDYQGFKYFANVLNQHPDYFKHIEKFLDTLCSHHDLIVDSLTPSWEDVKKEDFFCDADVNFSQTLLVVYGAIVDFILQYEQFEESTYKEWMRVVWNVVENTDIDNFERATTTSRILSNMLAVTSKNEDFYYGLSKTKGNASVERSRIAIEEIDKSIKIVENIEWLAAFKNIEKNQFVKGDIYFFFSQDMSISEFIHNSELINDIFDKKGITEKYCQEHILIRAIISNIKNWNKGLNGLYITEKTENHKYLKNLLNSDRLEMRGIRNMFADILSLSNSDEIIKRLNTILSVPVPMIDEAGSPLSGEKFYENKMLQTLKSDIKLYEWISSIRSNVRLSWYYGHYSIAVPRTWHDRILIDTDRDEMALQIIQKYGLLYQEDNGSSFSDYQKWGHFLGHKVLLAQHRDNYSFCVSFSENHNLIIYVVCPSEKHVDDFITKEGGTKKEQEWQRLRVYLSETQYDSKEFVNNIYELIERYQEQFNDYLDEQNNEDGISEIV